MKKEKILFVFLILFLNLFFISSSFISFVSAGELRVTQEHPFLVNDSWMSAKNLNVGDELFTIDGKKVRITEIEEVVSEESFSVYNLEAKKYSDFVVCGEDECDNDSLGVVVHNSGAKLIAKDIQYQSLGMAIDGTSEVPVILLNGPKKYFKFAGIWDRNAKLGWDDLTLELDSIIRSRFGFNINQPYMIINSNKWVGSTPQINALYHELRHLNLKQGESFSSILSSWDIFRGKKVTLKITPIDGGPETIINVGSNGIVTRIFKGAYSCVLNSGQCAGGPIAYKLNYGTWKGFYQNPYTLEFSNKEFVAATVIGGSFFAGTVYVYVQILEIFVESDSNP